MVHLNFKRFGHMRSCTLRGGWTAVCKDSREQFRPITIEKSHLAADHEMNIPSIVRLNNFVFFFIFRHWFVKKFLCWFSSALLIVLMGKSLKWVDFKGLFSSWFARHCKMAAQTWVFWVIQFEVRLFRFSVSRLVYFSQKLKKKYWSPILYCLVTL